MESVGRKRMRSEEASFVPQSKYYINQQLIAARDEEKLREIHDKTMNLLFRGANNFHNNNANVNLMRSFYVIQKIRLVGNGTIAFEGDEKPSGFPVDRVESKCCKKAALINWECRNCNLVVCEFCAYSCFYCSELLCGACVTLFGCGTTDNPCCDQCKMFS
ncbi:uncharacterized protein LOC119648370 [Hermetia illucens]|nr:uncharacterized protein LOC119648370 [Hermetia illucens]